MGQHPPRRCRHLPRLRNLLRRPSREESHSLQHEHDHVGSHQRTRDLRLPALGVITGEQDAHAAAR
jgi:hypothetical protein